MVTVAEAGPGGGTRGVRGGGLPWVQLGSAGEDPFVYRVHVCESSVPTYGRRMLGNRDRYARLEVHTVDGGQDYDIMGYSAAQVIHDCPDSYERYLGFLRLA